MDKNQYSDAVKELEAYLLEGLEFKAVGLWLGKQVTAARGSQGGLNPEVFEGYGVGFQDLHGRMLGLKLRAGLNVCMYRTSTYTWTGFR